jgi:hypothetical protein
MTKSERLMSLINYIRDNRAVTVPEMSDNFKVSHRTIYRDLNSLTKMNVPIYFEDGFRLSKEYSTTCSELSPDEMELVQFCLDNNPLVGIPYFDERFAAIKDHFRRTRKGEAHVQVDNLIVGERPQGIMPSVDSRETLEKFFSAAVKRHKIRLSVLHSWQEGLYIPLAVRVQAGGIKLVVTKPQETRVIEFALSEVTQVTVASERFDRRPVELLAAG